MEGQAETCKEVKGKAGGEVYNIVAAEDMGSCKEVPVGKRAELWTPSSRPMTAGSFASPALDQLTIFYCGKVVVFDAVPAEKIQEIMHLAAAAESGAKSGELKKIGSGCSAVAPVLTRSPPMQSTVSPQSQAYVPHNSFGKLQAELPFARRHSLQCFLEKRRDRFASKNPYPAASAGKKEETTTKPDTNAEKVLPSPNSVCFQKAPELQPMVAANLA